LLAFYYSSNNYYSRFQIFNDAYETMLAAPITTWGKFTNINRPL